MPFYAFKLSKLHVIKQRGRMPDNDIVTFNVFVNQVDRGHGTGFFPALAAGSNFHVAVVKANNVSGSMSRNWIIGPLEIAPGDLVDLVYSGTNTSDGDLDQQKQAEIQMKIMDKILSAAVGSITGPIGAVVGAVFGLIADPVKTILGFESQGPCNGVVFSDTVSFSGSGLESLAFQPSKIEDGFFVTLPNAGEVSFTRSYTDEATHNKDNCGDVANIEITFAVLKVPFVSVRNTVLRLFNTNLIDGVRRLAPPGTALSMRSFLRLRP